VVDIGAKLREVSLSGPVLVFIGRVFEGVGVSDSHADLEARAAEPKRLSQNPRP